MKRRILPIADCQLPMGRRGDCRFRIRFGKSPHAHGFTLVELLIIAGIIAILAGLLLPFVIRSRRTSQTTVEKFDFQAIDAALEAYRKDFGDYPRNILLPKWNTMQGGAAGAPTPAPVFYSLAAALLGPGPGVTKTINGDLQVGDGNDGPGFRCPGAPRVSGLAAATAGSTTVTITVDAASADGAAQFVHEFQPQGNINATLASITLFPSQAQPYQENIGISRISVSGGQLQLTLAVAPSYPHDGRCEISVASGKVWGPYLAEGAAKIAFIPSVDAYGSPFPEFGQPVLVDRWGQVIQYFPSYDPKTHAAATSDIGKTFFGYSQPKSVDPINGQNAVFDWRDGSPFFTINGQIGPAQAWPNPVSATLKSFRPELAILWMLGEPDSDGIFKNETGTTQKLNKNNPYILISAGPEGPERPNGGFCNLADWQNADNPMPANRLQGEFDRSGNIYNFERR